MKFHYFILVLLLLTSCQKIEEEEAEAEKGQLNVTCTGSQTWDEVTETRATNTAIGERGATQITYMILKDGKEVYRSSQTNGGGNSFGTLSVALDEGSYTLLAYADASKMGLATITEQGIVTPTHMSDSYCYKQDFQIKSSKTTTVAAKMTRCTARLAFTSLDDIPNSLFTADVTMSNVCTQYDLINQKGITVGQEKYTIGDVLSYKDGSKFNCKVYTFLPALQQTVSVKLNFYLQDGTKKYEVSIPSVTAKINRNTETKVFMFEE